MLRLRYVDGYRGLE